MCKCASVQVCKCPSVQVSGCPGVQVSVCPGVRVPLSRFPTSPSKSHFPSHIASQAYLELDPGVLGGRLWLAWPALGISEGVICEEEKTESVSFGGASGSGRIRQPASESHPRRTNRSLMDHESWTMSHGP